MGSIKIKDCPKCSAPVFTKAPYCRKCMCDVAKAFYSTPEGKAKRKAWRQTAKAKKYDKAYNAGDAAKAASKRWRKSESGKKKVADFQRRRVARKKAQGDATRPQILQMKREAKACFYCALPFKSEKEKTTDHVIPLSRNGAHSLTNLVICCDPCNSQKASMTPVEWEERKKMLCS